MKRKIKWGNVIKLLILILCVALVIHDMFVLCFMFAQFTYFGIATYIGALILISLIYEDFYEQTKNIPSGKHTKDIK